MHPWLQVHDIEDLAKIGKRNTACPYFAARHLADSAELIFCPYSYLLDPNIRRSTRVGQAVATGWIFMLLRLNVQQLCVDDGRSLATAQASAGQLACNWVWWRCAGVSC